MKQAKAKAKAKAKVKAKGKSKPASCKAKARAKAKPASKAKARAKAKAKAKAGAKAGARPPRRYGRHGEPLVDIDDVLKEHPGGTCWHANHATVTGPWTACCHEAACCRTRQGQGEEEASC